MDRVKLFREWKRKRAHVFKAFSHAELRHTLDAITEANGKAMGLQLIGMFKSCKACALGKAKKERVAEPCSIIKGERLFIDISSSSMASMGGKKCWLLEVEDSAN